MDGSSRVRLAESRLAEPLPERRSPGRRRSASAIVALLTWAVLIAVAHVLGTRLVDRVPKTRVFAAPLVARFDPHVRLAVLLPVALATVVVLFGTKLSTRLGWRGLLVAAFVVAGAWAVALALIDGVSELTRPLLGPSDYLRDVPLVGGPHAFLSGFVAEIGRYHQHVRGHPPGMVLLLWSMDRVRLGGIGWAAALEVAGGAAMVPAALVTMREVAGEARARVAAPFVALAPAAIWVATCGDALFAGVAAWAVALTVLAMGRRGPRSDTLAMSGGLLFGAGAMLSYGATLLALVPMAAAVLLRRVRPVVVATVGAAMVLLAFAAAGFWWLDGLSATTAQYRASVARLRPQSYFWLGDLAAFAIVVGPAAAVGLARLRDRATWFLVGAALVAVAVADASGLSKGEVERIWLPFAPWILLACSALAGPDPETVSSSRTASGCWLGVSLTSALALQLFLRTTW